MTTVDTTVRASEPSARISLRFAMYTALGLSLAALLIVGVVRSYAIEQAEASVKRHSGVVARSALAGALRAEDFTRTVGAERRAELDKIFRRRVLADGVVEAVFLAADGRITYATDVSRIGRRSQDASDVRRIFANDALHSRIETHSIDGGSQQVMKVFVPARFDGGRARGVLVLSHDWQPMLSSPRKVYIAVAVVLELVALALFALFFPVLRRVKKQLQDHARATEELAMHDSVTGLPSRLLFDDRAEQALLRSARSGEGVALTLIHLDRLQDINDTLGPERGDALLRELTERLSSAVRAGDTLARLKDAQFGVIATDAAEDDLTMIAERIVAVLNRPFFIEGVELDMNPRLGIARYPRDADDVRGLVLRAEMAMYSAREADGRYALYQPELEKGQKVSRLRGAIEAGELLLDFQPKFDLRSGAIVSAEALVRWRHPDRGLLSPDEFLADASEARQTPALTRWVLDSALRDCRAWHDHGWRLPVAVNVDARSLLDEAFVDEVELALNRTGLEPELLELEITEETLLNDPERVTAIVNRLSEYGVRVSLDEFGSGLASLAQLQGLHVHELKIDRALIARLGTDPTVKPTVGSILSLGKSLGLRVVAEGIETQAAARAVFAARCSFGQGFLLAEPVPHDEFMLVLEYTHQHESANVVTA
jgi:diguanylate cyclase